ncbi:hypothetical protein KKB83_05380 [Patescibacteria group bacterium]|nr:hypothetical protein [Patescibacteria group bacterium]
MEKIIGITSELITYLRTLLSDIFTTSAGLYLLLLAIEKTKPGFVGNAISEQVFLYITIAAVGLLILLPKERIGIERRTNLLTYLWVITAAILGGYIVYKDTPSLGTTGIVIGVLTSLLIVSLSMIVRSEQS